MSEALEAPDSERDIALSEARENRESFERLAKSDLPYAPYARRVLRLLDSDETDLEEL